MENKEVIIEAFTPNMSIRVNEVFPKGKAGMVTKIEDKGGKLEIEIQGGQYRVEVTASEYSVVYKVN